MANHPKGKQKEFWQTAMLLLGAFSFLFFYWNPFPNFSQPVATTLGILLLACIFWISEAIPFYVTSLLILALELVLLTPSLPKIKSEIFLTPFFSDTILLYLGGFTISSVLGKFEFDKAIATFALRKFGSSIHTLIISIMAVTAFLSLWMNNTATAALMLGIMSPVYKELKNYPNALKAITLAIPFAANIGGIGTPIGSLPNTIAIGILNNAEIDIHFLKFTLLFFPLAIILIGISYLILIFLFPLEKVDFPKIEKFHLRWNYKSRISLGVLIITLLLWMFSKEALGTISLLPIIFFYGYQILDEKDLRSVPWEILLLMGGGLSLGKAIEVSGFAKWFVEFLPIASLNSVSVVILFAAISWLMTMFLSNTTTANMILPLALGLPKELIAPTILASAIACSLGMPLPVSTPPNAMAFAKGHIKIIDMVKAGGLISIVSLVLLVLEIYFLLEYI